MDQAILSQKEMAGDDQPLLIDSRQTVLTAYDCSDAIFSACRMNDLTDGIYSSATTTYAEAQQNQINYLLDEIGCKAGSRILDIGCGYGTLLEAAEKRGAEAFGITLSPKQAQRCRYKGLNVKAVDYRDIGDEWTHFFDGIVANGSMEHFVQPGDVLHDNGDNIYREFFAICRRLINPDSAGRRLATTVIHFNRVNIAPEDVVKSPWSFRWGSNNFHFALVEQVLGGYYPIEGQLQRCARPHFELVSAVDGTDDYQKTSEYWLSSIRKSFVNPIKLAVITWRLLPFAVRVPRRVLLSLSLLITESWQWQFRGQHPPTKLWRHTWQAV